MELLSASDIGAFFLEWIASFAAIYLLILDRTDWKTNILTSLLIPCIFLSIPSVLFSFFRGAKATAPTADNLEKNILDEVVRMDDDEIEKAIKHGYLNTDSNFLKEDFPRWLMLCDCFDLEGPMLALARLS